MKTQGTAGSQTTRAGAGAAAQAQGLFDAFVAWVRPRLFVLSWTLCGLAVAVIVAAAMVTSRNARLARGFADLAKAETTDELVRLAKENAGTLCGEQAVFALAQKYLSAGECAQAATRFSLFCTEYPQSGSVLRARLGEAYALEGDKKAPQAEKAFLAVATEATTRGEMATAAEASLGAGRCAKVQGKLAEARKWYQQAVSSGAKDRSAAAAMEAMKALDVAEKAGAKAAAPVPATPPAADAAAPAVPPAAITPTQPPAATAATTVTPATPTPPAGK